MSDSVARRSDASQSGAPLRTRLRSSDLLLRAIKRCAVPDAVVSARAICRQIAHARLTSFHPNLE
ncbi:hypothetical protein EGY19_27390 [Burkholderia multivorans]|nr:hypothetical protein EGY19_27390 [Burkholderia multivorans]KVQ81413.1 hypothetical protein WK07_00905 [Burkholderia multivorans]KWA43167.1 hypothetical protein WL27_09615 [Burkholderia multivorans]PRF50785.1 hypothetical protein C6Q04_01120 [Burkholderia multivorans]PRG48977.1 hypothetical protein C6T63_21695 [Burkholderia multivorans]